MNALKWHDRRRPTQPNALRLRPLPAGAHPFSDAFALELRNSR
jgi:hypothetical protein